jgi:hypothetical protein
MRRRIRQWGERLYENEGLRDNLDDEQAKRLLDWGMKQLTAAAYQTLTLDDIQANERMEDAWLTLSRIIRQTNTFTAMLPTVVDDGEAGVLVDAFAGSVSELTGQAVDYDWIEGLVEKRGEMDAAATFDHLMSILTAQPVPDAEADADTDEAVDAKVTADTNAAAPAGTKDTNAAAETPEQEDIHS